MTELGATREARWATGGETGSRRVIAPPPGFAIVGLGVQFDPPYRLSAAASGGPPPAWVEDHYDWEPPNGGPTLPEVRMAGLVYGFPYAVCAPADEVARAQPEAVGGQPAADAWQYPGAFIVRAEGRFEAQPANHRAGQADLVAPRGFALAGIEVLDEGSEAGDAPSLGAEQVAVVWRQLGPPGAVGADAVSVDLCPPRAAPYVPTAARWHPLAGGPRMAVTSLSWAPVAETVEAVSSAPKNPRVGEILVASDWSDELISTAGRNGADDNAAGHGVAGHGETSGADDSAARETDVSPGSRSKLFRAKDGAFPGFLVLILVLLVVLMALALTHCRGNCEQKTANSAPHDQERRS